MVLPIHEDVAVSKDVELDWPCISIVFPFEPKMTVEDILEGRIQSIIEKVQKTIKNKFPEKAATIALDKLQSTVRKLDFSTYKKSVAIFVSSRVEKLYYLDFDVDEKININSSCKLRDIVNCKKDIHSFLLMVISAGRSRIYLGDTRQFTRISSIVPLQLSAISAARSAAIQKPSDPRRHKEVMLDKFLRQVDNGLEIILKAYGFPLFVMGSDSASGHFKKITHHTDRIIRFIPGNGDEPDELKIKKAVAPYIANWKKVKQDDLLHRLDMAKHMNKLATGIGDVWRETCEKRGRLLIVEDNYHCNTWKVEGKPKYCLEKEISDTPLLVTDLVDEAIERMIENGASVEFVEDGLLKDFNHIGLIK